MSALVSMIGKIQCGKWTCGFIVNTDRDYTMYIPYYEFSKYMTSGNRVLGFLWGNQGLDSIRGNKNDINRLREFHIEDTSAIEWNTYEEVVTGKGIRHTAKNRKHLKTVNKEHEVELDNSSIQILEIITYNKKVAGYKVNTIYGHELYIDVSDIAKYFNKGYEAYKVEYSNGLIVAKENSLEYFNGIPIRDIDNLMGVDWNNYKELCANIDNTLE